MPSEWKVTDKRYIAFFDIMGFKELVERNTHQSVVDKLTSLKKTISVIEKMHKNPIFPIATFKISESKAITFSDSIVIFSKDDSKESLTKILLDSSMFIYHALKKGVPIKGALSYGEVTVDFENSLFFGRPIIDSFLLHDQLQLYSAILDNQIEEKINSLSSIADYSELFMSYKTPLKGGRITHKIIRPPKANVKQQIGFLEKIYANVCGQPRIYVDNSLEFLRTIKLDK